jgi:hypothetical protein
MDNITPPIGPAILSYRSLEYGQEE